jgi:hypothetical protein
MKYILSLVVSLLFIGEKIENWEMNMEFKYKKYQNFKENILPWIGVYSAILSSF